MEPEQEGRRRKAWSAYWSAGPLHSCAGSFADNYEGPIAAFWREVFSALAPGARVLDLATGNGALPLLLWNQRRDDATLHIDAVDLASLAPRWHAPSTHPNIVFHPGVAMEALPFEAASFDLVTSQFGFEYAAREAALAEVLRVARPGGGIALVMHHAGSVLCEVARHEVAHARRLLAADGLLARARAVLPWFARARAGQPPVGVAAADHDRAAYNAALQALAAEAAAAAVPDLLLEAREHVHRQVAGVGADPAPALQDLANYAEALDAAALRSEELIAHALDEAGVQAMAARIAAARPGARIDIAPLAQAEGLLGWSLRVQGMPQAR